MIIDIDGVGYPVAPEVAALLQSVSEERDALNRENEVAWHRILAHRTHGDLSIPASIDRLAKERNDALAALGLVALKVTP